MPYKTHSYLKYNPSRYFVLYPTRQFAYLAYDCKRNTHTPEEQRGERERHDRLNQLIFSKVSCVRIFSYCPLTDSKYP